MANGGGALVLRARTRYTSEVERSASVVMMSVTIGAYQAVYFENVAQAVEYCHALVPHIVPRPGSDAIEDRAVVWFHVPERSRNSSRDGCYLFASTGAIAAAERAGLDTPLCGRVSRAALPPDAVLLFGDDAPPTPPRYRSGRRASAARRLVLDGASAPTVDARA
ncbi:MAG: hypothetical protein ACJ79Y_16745 [Myxococcales bacterium]